MWYFIVYMDEMLKKNEKLLKASSGISPREAALCKRNPHC